MTNETATVLAFPLSPRLRIRALTARCPALDAIVARLPSDGDPSRPACERALAAVFTRLLYLPDLTYDEAAAALDHAASQDAVTVEELALLYHDPDARERYDLWREVWLAERDPETCRATRYYFALLNRLYRMEYLFRRERQADAPAAPPA